MLDNTNETRQSELLNIQTNVEGNGNKGNSSELIHREKLEGTPFTIVGNDDNGYFLTMGKYKLTENKESIEQVKEYIESNKWDVIVRMITTTHEMVVNAMMEDQLKVKTVNESYQDTWKK